MANFDRVYENLNNFIVVETSGGIQGSEISFRLGNRRQSGKALNTLPPGKALAYKTNRRWFIIGTTSFLASPARNIKRIRRSPTTESLAPVVVHLICVYHRILTPSSTRHATIWYTWDGISLVKVAEGGELDYYQTFTISQKGPQAFVALTPNCVPVLGNNNNHFHFVITELGEYILQYSTFDSSTGQSTQPQAAPGFQYQGARTGKNINTVVVKNNNIVLTNKQDYNNYPHSYDFPPPTGLPSPNTTIYDNSYPESLDEDLLAYHFSLGNLGTIWETSIGWDYRAGKTNSSGFNDFYLEVINSGYNFPIRWLNVTKKREYTWLENKGTLSIQTVLAGRPDNIINKLLPGNTDATQLTLPTKRLPVEDLEMPLIGTNLLTYTSAPGFIGDDFVDIANGNFNAEGNLVSRINNDFSNPSNFSIDEVRIYHLVSRGLF